jgi:hypothetical protein
MSRLLTVVGNHSAKIRLILKVTSQFTTTSLSSTKSISNWKSFTSKHKKNWGTCESGVWCTCAISGHSESGGKDGVEGMYVAKFLFCLH